MLKNARRTAVSGTILAATFTLHWQAIPPKSTLSQDNLHSLWLVRIL